MRRDLGIALAYLALATCTPAEVRVQAPPHGPAPESGVPTTAPTASRVPVDPRGRWPSEETPASAEAASLFAEAAALPPPPVTPTPEPSVGSEQLAWAQAYWTPWFSGIADLWSRAELAALRAHDEPDAVTLGALVGVLTREIVDAMDRAPWPSDDDDERRYQQEVSWGSHREFALRASTALRRCIASASPALSAWRTVCAGIDRELMRDPRAPPHLATFPVDCTFPPPGVPVASRRPRAPITDIVVALGVVPLLGAERVRVAEALAARLSVLEPTRHYFAEGAAVPAPAGAPVRVLSCRFYDCPNIADGDWGAFYTADLHGPLDQLSIWLSAATSLHVEHRVGFRSEVRLDLPPRRHSGLTAIAGTGWPEAAARAAITPLVASADACVVTAPNGPDVVGVVIEVAPDGRVQAEPTAAGDRARCVADVFAAARLPPARRVRRAALSIALGDASAHSVELRVARWDALRSWSLSLFHALAPCVAGLPADAVRAVRLVATVDGAGHATITSAEPFAAPADDALAQCVADAYRHVVLVPGDPGEQLDDVVCVAHHVVDSDIERAIYPP